MRRRREALVRHRQPPTATCSGRIRGQEGRNTFNPVQTKLVVDCAASFPNVQDFDMNAGEVVSTCMSVAANLRAGRFSNLRRLEIDWPRRSVNSSPKTFFHV